MKKGTLYITVALTGFLIFFLLNNKKKTLKGVPDTDLERLFSGISDGKEETIYNNTTFKQTLEKMAQMAKSYAYQTAPLAKYLEKQEGDKLNNLFSFIMNNFRYKDDADGEELRTPLRAWRDRKKGVDCDCFSIFLGSVLENWRMPYLFRVVQPRGSADYGHVYTVALRPPQTEVVLDPVIGVFNAETPYIKKIDVKKQ